MKNLNDIEKELQLSIYDPNLIQVKSLALLDNLLDGKGDIPDPNNPFTFLMENNALITSAAIKEVTLAMRKSYPELAETKEDLYGFINTTEINDIFAIASTAKFNMFIRLDDVLKYGYNNGTSTKITIPRYSNIVVDNIPFTILNDIIVHVYNDGKTFSMYIYNKLDISLNSDTILESGLVSDSEGIKWIMLSLDIPQIKRYSFKENIFTSNVFKSDAVIDDTDYYTYVSIETSNPISKNKYNLDITYSNFVYNPKMPTMIVRPGGNKINFELPYVYNVKNMIDKYLNFTLFTTRGKIEVPLSKYDTTDFIFNVNMPTTTNESIIGLQNISIKLNSNSYTYGGRNEVSFNDLKSRVLNYSLGNNSLPITNNEIISEANKYGFVFDKHINNVTSTTTLLTKYIDKLNYDVKIKMDILNSNISLNMNNNYDKINIFNINSVIIEPYQLFEKTDNILKPLTTAEQLNISNIAVTDVSEYNKHNVFFNLYKYILDYGDIVTSRVYDVNSPSIANVLGIKETNNKKNPFIITDRVVLNKGNSYEIYITIAGNNELQKINLNKTFCQLTIDAGPIDKLYLKGTITMDTNTTNLIIKFIIDNESYINTNNKLIINNTIIPKDFNNLKSGLVDLNTRCNINIYSTDNLIVNNNSINTNKIVIENATTVFYEETFNLIFGKYLDKLFTSYIVNFTDRKFETYIEDIYKTYTEDVYELDETGTIKLTPIDTDGNGINDDVTLNKLHSKGDVILDSNNKPVILHAKGDIKLDKNNKPILNPNVGLLHNLNILLLEDKFLRTTNTVYNNYRIDFFLKLTNIITEEINVISNEVLENTDVLFTPSIELNNVTLIKNNIAKSYPNNISPTVNIYLSDETFIITDYIKNRIHNILQDNIVKNINIGDIEKLILDELPNTALSVKINNIIPDELVVINYAANSSKFFINKLLIRDVNGDTVVVPDIKIALVTL